MFKLLNSDKLNRYLFIDLIGLSLLAYSLTLAPSVLMADAGEFQFVPRLPGIAHPTGYPLYTLLGWLFSYLVPYGDVAWRLNFFSAVTGAFTVGIVYLISQELTTHLAPDSPPTAHRLTAIGVALTFAFGHTFWSQVIIAEVYGLHALFVALLLWEALHLILKQRPPTDDAPEQNVRLRPFKTTWRLALLLGLSLTHHRTITLMFPALGLYLWVIGWRWGSLKTGLKLLLVSGLPGLLYLYIPLIAPHVPYAEISLSADQTLVLYEQSVSGFINHIMGQVFSSEVKPAALNLDRLLLSLQFLRQQVGWVGGALALVGLGVLLNRWALLALTLGSFLGFLAFNLIYQVGDIVVFYIPCWLILSLWLGVGWLHLSRWVAQTIVRAKKARVTDIPGLYKTAQRVEQRIGHLLGVGLAGLLLILPVVLFITRYSEVDQSQSTLAQEAWLNIMATDLPAGAILLSNDRNEMMPMWYYQWVEGKRPDLLGLFPLITSNPEVSNIGRLLDYALQSERPVFLVKPMPGLEIKGDLTPLAPLPQAQLIAVTPPNQKPEHPTRLSYDNQLTLIGFDQTQTTRAISVTLYWQAETTAMAHNYTSYVHLVDLNGNGKSQGEDHQIGGVYHPTSLWIPNEILRDTHIIPLPASLPAGEYKLRAGLYHQPQPGQLEALGIGQILGGIILE